HSSGRAPAGAGGAWGPAGDRVRPPAGPGGRDRFEPPLVADRLPRQAVLAGEVAQDPIDRDTRRLAVEPNRGEGSVVAVPGRANLGLLIRRREQRRHSLARNQREPEPADLHPVARLEQDVRGEPQQHCVDVPLAHRLLELHDATHAGTSSMTCLTPVTTSSTCGSTSRSSAVAYGIGVSFAVTRTGAARNESQTSSTRRATTSLA